MAPHRTSCAMMSIDVEDWFQVENLKGVIERDSWNARELRVERNMDRMLEMLDQHNVKCTAFLLGWVAERCPDLVRRISDAGHEIASHGYGHDLVYTLSPDEFREDLRRGAGVFEDLIGDQIRGYRAPSFSITDWAIDILQEQGYLYDSSAFPTTLHDRYGKLDGMGSGQQISEIRDGFFEVALSVQKVGRRGIPWSGGGYFRLLPYSIFRWGVQRILETGSPFVFYLHPWEIDAKQPRVDGLKRFSKFRHYNNLDKCHDRFDAILGAFEWCTVGEFVDRYRRGEVPT